MDADGTGGRVLKNCSLFVEGNSKNLEQFLINSGLSQKEVEVLKVEQNEGAENYYKRYTNSNIENKRLVPVSKIIGIGARGSINESWFENLLNCCKEHNFRSKSINELLTNMNRSIHDFRGSFKKEEFSTDNLGYVHFVEDDVYVSTSGGSHRTLFSKISGAEYILAKVTEFNFDKEKDSNYKKVQTEQYSLKKILREMNLEIYTSEVRGKLKYRIGYNGIGIIEHSYISILDYSNESSVNNALTKIHQEKEYLSEIRDEYVKLALFPYKLRKLIIRIKINFNSKWALKHLKELIDLGWSF